MPSVSDTSGPAEDRPGADDATSAFEKIASATKPIAPGSSHRNGATDPSKARPNTSGINGGPRTAAATVPVSVSSATARNARTTRAARSAGYARAASGRMAVATAPAG